ncbi:unnamed protein product, partial [Effrenium voratum]
MPRLACDPCSRWVWSSESRDQHVGAKPGAEAGAWLKCEDCDRQFQGEYALWQRQQSKHGKHGKDQPELKGAAEKEQQNNEQDVASKSLYTYETSCMDDSEVGRATDGGRGAGVAPTGRAGGQMGQLTVDQRRLVYQKCEKQKLRNVSAFVLRALSFLFVEGVVVTRGCCSRRRASAVWGAGMKARQLLA